MTVQAVDVSNYTDPLTPDALACFKASNIGLVIVQSLDAGRFPTTQTRAQLQACADAGLPADVYVYPFFANGEGDCAQRLSEALKGVLPVRRVWLDLEDNDASSNGWTPAQRIALVRLWLDACDRVPTTSGLPAGIYTGLWFWRGYMGDTNAFVDRDLWASQYDDNPDASVLTLFGGWTPERVAIKQFSGTTSLCGIGNVDADVLSETEAARLQPPQPQPEPVPAGDDPGWVAKKPAVVQAAGAVHGILVPALVDLSHKSYISKLELRRLAGQVDDAMVKILT